MMLDNKSSDDQRVQTRQQQQRKTRAKELEKGSFLDDKSSWHLRDSGRYS